MHMMGAEQMPARMPIGFAILSVGVRATVTLWQLEKWAAPGIEPRESHAHDGG